jgi:DUF4097 and DUF4098 domain-containing protein YvlB
MALALAASRAGNPGGIPLASGSRVVLASVRIRRPGGWAPRLTDVFGNLTASGLAGTIRLDNNSGDITAAGLTGDTRLQDSFGNIEVTGLASADVVASNQSGDITLTFSKVPRRVNVTDSFGNITLNLPPGPTAYRVSARTSFGSSTISVPQATSAPDVITVTNNSGDITIASRGNAAPPRP